jgi:hypothetical protein
MKVHSNFTALDMQILMPCTLSHSASLASKHLTRGPGELVSIRFSSQMLYERLGRTVRYESSCVTCATGEGRRYAAGGGQAAGNRDAGEAADGHRPRRCRGQHLGAVVDEAGLGAKRGAEPRVHDPRG